MERKGEMKHLSVGERDIGRERQPSFSLSRWDRSLSLAWIGREKGPSGAAQRENVRSFSLWLGSFALSRLDRERETERTFRRSSAP